MKLSEIVKIAAGVAGTMNPAIGAAISLVNGFLPEGKKLPETATGKDVQDVIQTLPAETQATLLSQEIQLEVAREEGWTARYTAMTKADGQETRAKIVNKLCNVLIFEILAFTVLMVWKPQHLSDEGVWMVFGILTATPATVILNYFGNLRKEHAQRQMAMGAAAPQGLLSKLTSVIQNR